MSSRVSSPSDGSSPGLLDPTREYRLERGALRLIETLFRPGDVVCLAWKVAGAGGTVRMHHDYRLFEQLVAQHRGGRGILRQLSTLNDPAPLKKPLPDGLFDRRHRSDVYFCVNPLREQVDPKTGESAYRRRRTHVAAVRTIGMDMDDGGPAGLARLSEDVADGLLPPPHLVVQTSHGTLGVGDRSRYHQKCQPGSGSGPNSTPGSIDATANAGVSWYRLQTHLCTRSSRVPDVVF